MQTTKQTTKQASQTTDLVEREVPVLKEDAREWARAIVQELRDLYGPTGTGQYVATIDSKPHCTLAVLGHHFGVADE